ncbi:MAG: DUF3828 domain-containing protein [Candidatus Xenobiia bacterium LiM19]
MKQQGIFIAFFILLMMICAGNMAAICSTEKKAAPCDADQKNPAALVNDFYKWYLKDQKSSLKNISQWKECFEEKLYVELLEAMNKTPENGNKLWLDFDPFVNAQEYAISFTLGKASQKNNTATVIVAMKYDRDARQSLKVFLIRSGDIWRMANLIYDDNTTLYKILKTINRKK